MQFSFTDVNNLFSFFYFQRLATPWKAIFTSVPVWVSVIANTSNDLAFVIFMTEIPMYLSTALHFDVENVRKTSLFSIITRSKNEYTLLAIKIGTP